MIQAPPPEYTQPTPALSRTVTAEPVRLETYDRGYRDGWRDIHSSMRQRRKRQRARLPEYALGYLHGRVDGAVHPFCPDWLEGHRAGSLRDLPEPAATVTWSDDAFAQPAAGELVNVAQPDDAGLRGQVARLGNPAHRSAPDLRLRRLACSQRPSPTTQPERQARR